MTVRLEAAALAWDRGDYVTALDTYLRVLESSPGQADIETIALQTGELYRTTELTTHGALPRFSPDGRTLLYETGLGLARITRILPANGSTVPVMELHGFGAVYSPDGTRLAYLAVPATPELARAEAAIDQGPPAERARRQADFNELVAGASRIVVRNVGTGRESEVPLPGFSKAQLAYGARGVWFSGRGPGDVALQIYEVHDDGRADRTHIRTTGPADRPDECDRDGAALHAAGPRIGKRPGSSPSPHLYDHRDRHRACNDDERLRPGILRGRRHIRVRDAATTTVTA